MTGKTFLQRKVMDVLMQSPRLMASQISRLIPGDHDVVDVRIRLKNLVEARYAQRHHNDDGTLAYTATATGVQRYQGRKPGALTDAIRAALRELPGGVMRPLQARVEGVLTEELVAQIASGYTVRQVVGVLCVMRNRGEIAQRGRARAKRWMLIEKPSSVLPPAPSSAHDDAPTGPAPVAVESPALPLSSLHPASSQAATPETSAPSVATQVRTLADDLEIAARAMASTEPAVANIARVIASCSAKANHLYEILSSRGAA